MNPGRELAPCAHPGCALSRPGSWRGLSLLELVIGVAVLAVSALPVLELIRSSTASMEFTQEEIAVRTLAADILQLIAVTPPGVDLKVELGKSGLLVAPVAWDIWLQKLTPLSAQFPMDSQGPILKRISAQFVVTIDPLDAQDPTGLRKVLVTARWNDRGEPSRPREVKLARVVAP